MSIALDSVDSLFLKSVWEDIASHQLVEEELLSIKKYADLSKSYNWEETVTNLTDHYLSSLELLMSVADNSYLEIFRKYRIFVVPNLRFDAYSTIFNGRPYVIIHSGVFEILSYSLEIEFIVRRIIYESRYVSHKTGLLIEWVKNPGTQLLARRLVEPFSLPNLRQFLTAEMSLKEVMTLAHQELFIIFHEIGHHELGHLDEADKNQHKVFEYIKSSPVEDEFYADEYAFKAISSLGVEFISRSIGSFFQTQSCFENLFCQDFLEHPPASQRLMRMVELSGDNYSDCERNHLLEGVDLIVDAEDVFKTRYEEYLDELLWGCSNAYKELKIAVDVDVELEVDAQYEYDIRESKKNLQSMLYTPNAFDGNDVRSTVYEFLRLENEWEIQKEFIENNLSIVQLESEMAVREELLFFTSYVQDEAEGCLIIIEKLKELLLFIEHCKEFGIEKSRPVLGLFFELIYVEGIYNLGKMSEKYPGFLSREAIECIELKMSRVSQRFSVEIELKISAYINALEKASIYGVDHALQSLKPDVRNEKWAEGIQNLSIELAQACREKDLALQKNICLKGIELAEKEDERPIWLLYFHLHLSSMPDM